MDGTDDYKLRQRAQDLQEVLAELGDLFGRDRAGEWWAKRLPDFLTAIAAAQQTISTIRSTTLNGGGE